MTLLCIKRALESPLEQKTPHCTRAHSSLPLFTLSLSLLLFLYPHTRRMIRLAIKDATARVNLHHDRHNYVPKLDSRIMCDIYIIYKHRASALMSLRTAALSLSPCPYYRHTRLYIKYMLHQSRYVAKRADLSHEVNSPFPAARANTVEIKRVKYRRGANKGATYCFQYGSNPRRFAQSVRRAKINAIARRRARIILIRAMCRGGGQLRQLLPEVGLWCEPGCI